MSPGKVVDQYLQAIFEAIWTVQFNRAEKKRLAALVPSPGLEPGPREGPHFECGASTYSAKRARHVVTQ